MLQDLPFVENVVQPKVYQVLAMREDDKTFTAGLALLSNFIHHLKHNPSNVRRVAKLGSGGCGGRKRCDAGGRGGGKCGHGGRGAHRSASKGGVPDQSEVDKVTWLHANKYYTTKEYAKFTAAKKVWVHQNRSVAKSPTTKRKVAAVTRGEDNTAAESDNNKDLFGDQDNASARGGTD
jgi:hypothetical protein